MFSRNADFFLLHHYSLFVLTTLLHQMSDTTQPPTTPSSTPVVETAPTCDTCSQATTCTPATCTPATKKARKRCYACRKKLGLAGGIKCKCGFVFCSKHRYPNQHACTFDFKAHDRALLAKDVVGGGAFAKVERV